MTAPVRTALQREADLVLIEQWYVRDRISQGEIAEKLRALRGYEKLTQQAISNDIKFLQKRWREMTTMDLDDLKATELRRIDQMELEYWSAWQESKLDAETKTQKVVGEGKDAKKEVSLRREGRTGNPAYLAGVQWCVEQRCKLLGLYQPQKVELSWREEAVRDIKDGKFTFEEIAAAFNDEALARKLFEEAGVQPLQ